MIGLFTVFEKARIQLIHAVDGEQLDVVLFQEAFLILFFSFFAYQKQRQAIFHKIL